MLEGQVPIPETITARDDGFLGLFAIWVVHIV